MNKKAKNLLFGGTLWYLGEGMLGPLFAVFAERVGGDVLEISWAWATFLIVSGLLTIVVGIISDRTKADETLMVIGYFLNAVMTFAYLLVHDQTSLLIVQAGLGVASALASPTWDALYAKHENRKKDGLVWGLASGGAEVVMGAALLLGGFIVAHYSFAVLFITMGIVQTIAAIYQAKILRMR